MSLTEQRRHRVVVIGCGFGGLFAVEGMDDERIDLTIVDRTTNHVFQPLLYQVATGILSEGDVAPAIRSVLRHRTNTRVVMAEVTTIDLARSTITARTTMHDLELRYDSLIVAAGATQSYFGHEEFARHAPGLKTIDDALDVRRRLLGAFEMAEVEPDPERRQAWLTFAWSAPAPPGSRWPARSPICRV